MQASLPKVLKLVGKTLAHHYAGIIEEHIKDTKAAKGYLAVDGYLIKRDFRQLLLKEGLHIITKARQDPI